MVESEVLIKQIEDIHNQITQIKCDVAESIDDFVMNQQVFPSSISELLEQLNETQTKLGEPSKELIFEGQSVEKLRKQIIYLRVVEGLNNSMDLLLGGYYSVKEYLEEQIDK
jgi:hypothetical protein